MYNGMGVQTEDTVPTGTSRRMNRFFVRQKTTTSLEHLGYTEDEIAERLRRPRTNLLPLKEILTEINIFGPDNRRPSLLLGLHDHKLTPLRLLLSHLLLLHRSGKLRPIRQMRDRHVIKDDVEVPRSLRQTLPHQRRHVRSLRQQLIGVELRDDGLQNLVTDRRKHLLVVLGTECLEDSRKVWNVGTGEDTEGEIHHLKILRPRSGRVRTSKVTGFGSNGIRKCVPSPTVSFRTPRNLSKRTHL